MKQCEDSSAVEHCAPRGVQGSGGSIPPLRADEISDEQSPVVWRWAVFLDCGDVIFGPVPFIAFPAVPGMPCAQFAHELVAPNFRYDTGSGDPPVFRVRLGFYPLRFAWPFRNAFYPVDEYPFWFLRKTFQGQSKYLVVALVDTKLIDFFCVDRGDVFRKKERRFQDFFARRDALAFVAELFGVLKSFDRRPWLVSEKRGGGDDWPGEGSSADFVNACDQISLHELNHGA